MAEQEKLKICRARLAVEPRGYWFTAGGEKGSFGYYPHLRDAAGRPLYPDTQLRGDLRMAADWLVSLGAADQELVTLLFGSGGGEYERDPRPAGLLVGDLVFAEASRERWEPGRFEVKSRIMIDDATRTVAEHFLVDLELARLDGLNLTAPIFLAVPATKMEAAQKLVGELLPLLSGFGAFRSRGYGRGTISLGAFRACGTDPASDKDLSFGRPYRYALEALVNVRLKPVDPGSAQVLTTRLALAPEQLRGWLANAWRDECGAWPEPVLLERVRFSPLYPAPDTNVLAFPPLMSTLKDAEGKVRDTWQDKRDEKDADDAPDNFFAGKVKPLAGGLVTEKGGWFPVMPEIRFRNAMDARFVTTKNGLFAQELLPAGTIFTGTVEFDKKLSKEERERHWALARRIAEDHRGTLEIDTEPGRGTTIRMFLSMNCERETPKETVR